MAYDYGKFIGGMKFNGKHFFADPGSWTCQEPGDDSTLWRYMSFAKFCSLLEQRALFFSLVGDMEDRYEGFVYPLTPGEQEGQYHHMAPGLLRLLRVIARNSLVSCWTESSHESSLMWETYGSREGVAVRTTFRRLQESLSSDAELPVRFGRVEYVDYHREEISKLGLAPLFHKRMEFRGEREVRAVLPGPPFGEELHPGELPDVPLDSDVDEQRGRYIPVNLGILLEEIVLPPHAAPWFGRIVESAIKSWSVSVHVKRSSIESVPDY